MRHGAGADLAAAPADARGRAFVGPLQLRDGALDRAARYKLHDGERNQHDAEMVGIISRMRRAI